MRFVIGITGAVCLAGVSLAQADPSQANAAQATPASTAAPSTTTTSATPPAPPAASPAAPAQAATAAAAKPAVVVESTAETDALERHFLAEGYKLEMHNGEKLFCRREEELGSRLGSHKACGTVQQLAATEREAHAAYMRGQTQQNNPSGK